MSATNRTKDGGEATPRHASDYYPTPAWVADVAYRVLQWHGLDPRRDGSVMLDPCAGAGAFVANWLGWGVPDEHIHAIELDPVLANKVPSVASLQVGDALSYAARWPEANVVLTNPPYSRALEFVYRALDTVRETKRRGAVVMLLRLGFLCSRKRESFWRGNPADVHPLSKRPSFTGDGKTDAADYGLFCWTFPRQSHNGRLVFEVQGIGG